MGTTGTNYSASFSVSLNTAIGTTAEFSYGDFRDGFVIVPTGSSVTSLTYWVSGSSGGTYIAAHDASGTAITQTVAGAKAYALPAALAGARWVKIVSNAAGTVTITAKQ